MDVINQLQQLDFRLYPLTEIDRLLSSLGKIGFMITDYHEKQKNGHEIEFERAVNNTKEEPEFNSVSRISFKPAEYNSNYLRASTPKNTMFYGSVLSEKDYDPEKLKYNRIIGSSEISSLIRNSDVIEGWSRITFGKWSVTEKISLVTIIDPTIEYKHPYLNKLRDDYLEFLQQMPKDVQENTIKCLKFLSSEFSKYVSSGNNHEYLISSKFTELLTNNSANDGVVYPSVQSHGYGLCVAIHPKAINKLQLKKVLQCRLTKTLKSDGENNFSLHNEKHCLVENGAKTFELKAIEK